MTIEQVLRTSGYKVVTIWEHESDKNGDMKNIKLDEYDLVEPPKIREDTFHRGRCEPIKLTYDFKSKDTRGKYIDVVSLYPSVMYYDRFPTGHPTKIAKPIQNTITAGLGLYTAESCLQEVYTYQCYRINRKQNNHKSCCSVYVDHVCLA